MQGDVTIPVGVTMTIGPDTVIKAVNGVDLFVDGTLNVTATLGNEAVFTDLRDDNYNGDSNSDGASSGSSTSNCEGIDFRAGSTGTVDNLIVEYAQISMQVQNAGNLAVPDLNFTNLTINNCVDGLYVYQTSSTLNTAPTFNGLSVNECSSQHMYLNASNTTTTGPLLRPSFSGSLTVTDIVGTIAVGSDGIYLNNVGANVNVSGFTITGTTEGVVVTAGSSLTVENNLIRQAANTGINLRATSSPIIRNNIIVNNGNGDGNDSGIYANAGTNGFIVNNVIRQNEAAYGAGIMIRDSSPIIQNNLIIENRDTSPDLNGGSGIYIFRNSSPTILNNTIANNTSVTTTQGGGLSIQSLNGSPVILDNIIYGNTDGNSAASDVYHDGVGTIATENFNLMGTHNLASTGVNDALAVDPLFTDGWYLTVDALDGGGTDSPVIDVGSDLAANTALGSGIVVLTSTTTRTDGINELTSQVDFGYHYPDSKAAPVISAGVTTVTPPSFNETAAGGGTQIVITITPKDASNQNLGSGLNVTVSTTQGNIGLLSDLGDGTYQVTYTIPSGSSSDNVVFTVNGVLITGQTALTWAN